MPRAWRISPSSLDVPRLHFVGHSLGGMIVWRTLLDHAHLPAGRAVLLGSPVLGSHAARRFADHAIGQTLLGRSIRELMEGDAPAAAAPRERAWSPAAWESAWVRLSLPTFPRPMTASSR